MKTQLLIVFAFVITATLSAQNYQTITGQILDQKTGKAIAYANIGIPEKGIGTTSGDDGRFTFKVPDYYANSTMLVSVIGYKTYRKAVKQVTSPITVKLERTAYNLVEIEVMDEFRVENIIKKAVANIPQNYPTHATKVLGFYRESRTDSTQKHVYMAEGVLNIYKNSYKSRREGTVSLVQGRKINLKNPLDTVVYGGFSSGHMAAHRFDFVKNRADFIDEDFFHAYKYWIETVTTYNDRPVYVIAFDKDENQKSIKTRKAKKQSASFFEKLFSKEERLEARMKGKVYIDKESYAFIRAEFEITPKGLKRYNDYPLYAGRWTSNSYVVNYRQLGDKWYFSDALREGGRYSGGLYTNEIKITEINTEKATQLPYLDRLERGEEFVDMTGHYDENFWKSYNITPMSTALSESVQQFRNEEKARQVFDPAMMRAVQDLRDSMAIAEQLAKAEAIAKENNEEFKPESIISIGEPGVQKEEEKNNRVEMMFGFGAHLISTPTTQMGITYTDLESGQTIVSETNTIDAKDFEIMASWDFNIFFRKNWFVRFGAAGDFTNNIYKESSLGIGTQFNFSKQRPFLFKLSAQHSRIRYARELGATQNDFGEFKVKKKKFKADRIRLYYGSRTHNVKLSAEFAIELKRHQELYVRGSYYLPFARRQDVYFKETGELFKKKERLAADDLKLSITRDDVPFKGRLMEEQSLMVTVGFLFK